jgi:hypothetical protein
MGYGGVIKVENNPNIIRIQNLTEALETAETNLRGLTQGLGSMEYTAMSTSLNMAVVAFVIASVASVDALKAFSSDPAIVKQAVKTLVAALELLCKMERQYSALSAKDKEKFARAIMPLREQMLRGLIALYECLAKLKANSDEQRMAISLVSNELSDELSGEQNFVDRIDLQEILAEYIRDNLASLPEDKTKASKIAEILQRTNREDITSLTNEEILENLSSLLSLLNISAVRDLLLRLLNVLPENNPLAQLIAQALGIEIKLNQNV